MRALPILVSTLFAITATVCSAQLMPYLQAYASDSITFNDTGTQTVASLPDEASESLNAGTSTASGTASLIDDMHIRLQAGASSGSDGREARGYAEFNMNFIDTLAFTSSASVRDVRVHWKVEFDDSWDSTFLLSAKGGDGFNQLMFGGTVRVQKSVGYLYHSTQNFMVSYLDNFRDGGTDILPSALEGSMDFSLNPNENLQIANVRMFATTGATGSVQNAVFGDIVANAWVWVEVLTPGIELQSTQSIFTDYSVSPTAVPEPSVFSLLAGGLAIVCVATRRRRR